jgi:hypothetical protein
MVVEAVEVMAKGSVGVLVLEGLRLSFLFVAALVVLGGVVMQ